MLLFVSGTSEDKVEILNFDTFEKLAEVQINEDAHGLPIGPRTGIEFMGYGIIANCFDDTISVVDGETQKEVKTLCVGRYPISMAKDEDNLYITCGDSNSIWTVDAGLEVAFVDTTVEFPFAIAQAEGNLCVCSFSRWEAIEYSLPNMVWNKTINLPGYPMCVAYIKGIPMFSCNTESSGGIYRDGLYIPLGERVDKLIIYEGEIYIIVNDENILVLDEKLKRIRGFCTEEPINDFIVYKDEIVVSGLLSGKVKKFSQKGELLNCTYMGKGARSLFLLPK